MRCVYPGKLLGLVDVTQSMGNLTHSARVEVARSSHALLTGGTSLSALPWDHVRMLKNAAKKDKQAIIYLKDQCLQVVCDNVTVTEHKLSTISVLIHIAQVPGVVVFIGACRMTNMRRAVVLHFGALDIANIFISTYKEIKKGSSNSYVAPTMPPTAERPLTQPPLFNRPLPQLPTDRPLPTPPAGYKRPLPATPTTDRVPSEQRQEPPSNVRPGDDRPLPTNPHSQPREKIPIYENPLAAQPTQLPTPHYKPPLPAKPTTDRVPSEQRQEPPSNVRPGNDRPLPTNPHSQPREKIPIYENPLAAQPTQLPTPHYKPPLPATPTTDRVPSEQRQEPPSNVRPGNDRPLPTNPHSQPQEKIPIYENPLAAQPTPPVLPLRYENVQELKMRSLAEVDNAQEYDVDDWSEEGGNVYENASQYYNTLGFNQEEFEQLYMTQSETEEIKHEESPLQYENQPSLNSENQPAKVEVEEAIPEPLPEPTLEEDIQSFLKDEFKFKNTIWRIREAKPSLTSNLRSLLQGTEMMANIHNDMYIEIYEGYRSASRIAEVFLARTDQLQRYKFFLSNSPKIKRLIQEQPSMVKKKFPKLESDIQLSWKRLNFYLRSLEAMLATAPPKDQPSLQVVVKLLKELNREGDSGMMMEAVRGAPFNLTDYAPLLLHSSFGIRTVSLQDMKSACHVLLFPKILLLTATKDDGYEYLRHLPLAELKILPSKQERSFVLSTQDGERFGLRTASEEKSQLWLQRLHDLLGQYITTHC